MTPHLVLVDFDDTLVDTGPRFSTRRARLFDFLAERGFRRSEAERVHHEVVELELLPLMGFGPFRLGASFRDTYLRLCVETGRPPSPFVAREAERLADGIETPSSPFPGAIEALARLASGFPTVLYTQSSFPDYQLECVRAAGVFDVLTPERVHVTPLKSTSAFRALLEMLDVREPAHAVMIGNSVRADVNPALEAGARAIWVNGGEVWHHDAGEPLDPAVPRASRFIDAVEQLAPSDPGI